MIQARTGHSPFTAPFSSILPEDEVVFLQWVEERRRGRPLGYIAGQAFFWGRPIEVVPGVFIPRVESERLVEVALDLSVDTRWVVDLGTGAGGLLLAFLSERPNAYGVGIDCSVRALRVAAHNAKRWEIAPRVMWVRADGGRLPLSSGFADVVLANPPYVPRGEFPQDPALHDEPAHALYSEEGGIGHIRRWILEALRVLRPGGIGVIEASEVVRPRLDAWLKGEKIAFDWVQDASGKDRGVVFTRTS